MKLDFSLAIFYCFNLGYYELEIFQDEDKPHHSTMDRPLHQMRGRISSVKSSASYNPPPRSEKAKTGESKRKAVKKNP